MFDNLFERIRSEYEKRDAVLYAASVTRDGLNAVRYFAPSSLAHNCYSVSKLYTVTACGFLHDEGKLSPEEYLCDVLKDHFPKRFDPKWKDVTLHHLLVHRSGLTGEKNYLDIDRDNVTAYGTKNYLEYALSFDLEGVPGEDYCYTDLVYYLLSRVVAEKAGVDMLSYLREKLFNPLDYEEVAWSVCPAGHPVGGTGLYLRTADMAKLGELYLNEGNYQGKQILSADWCSMVLSRGYELARRPEPVQESYWKGGMYGQNLYVSPASNAVYAWHGYGYNGIEEDVMEAIGI